MNKRFFKGKKKNDFGFSLVEVLMAVALLGLVAAPLLQMFYSSFAMNVKSKRYLAAADLTQAIMEGVSAHSWEDSTPTKSGSSAVPQLRSYYYNGGAALSGIIGPGQKSITPGSSVKGHFYTSNVDLTNKTVTYRINDITYAGYPFEVVLKYDYSGEIPAGYYSVPVTLMVYDYPKGTSGPKVLIEETSTMVTSKW